VRFTRPRDLAIAGVLAGVALYLVMQSAYGSMPPLPTLAGVTLVVIAVIDVVLAFSLRSKIRSGKLIQPLSAARAVALAKASSMLGAIMLGAWLGVLVYVLPKRSELVAAANDTSSSVIGALCAAALIAAGLWLEHCCRTPDDPNEKPDR
jgi:hypothetical protein